MLSQQKSLRGPTTSKAHPRHGSTFGPLNVRVAGLLTRGSLASSGLPISHAETVALLRRHPRLQRRPSVAALHRLPYSPRMLCRAPPRTAPNDSFVNNGCCRSFLASSGQLSPKHHLSSRLSSTFINCIWSGSSPSVRCHDATCAAPAASPSRYACLSKKLRLYSAATPHGPVPFRPWRPSRTLPAGTHSQSMTTNGFSWPSCGFHCPRRGTASRGGPPNGASAAACPFPCLRFDPRSP